MKKTFILSCLLLIAFFSNAQVRYLKGVLQGSQETSPTATGAGGVVIVRYNTTTNFLELWGNYRNLSATISGSHIHGPFGPPGQNANVLINLNNTGGTDGGLTGTATLTEADETQLLAGNMYANVHSTGTYAVNGEIRAQLTAVAQDQAVLLNGRLQGAQETPPNPSPATGTTNVLVDKSTHTLWITATYSGLVAAASASHIHTGAPTVQGGISVFVQYTAATAGSIDTSRVISTQIETDILNGNTYLNLHTATYGGGEIRGQILPATQLRYFAGVLEASQEVAPPAVVSSGRGIVVVKYNTETNLFELIGDYQNLTSNLTFSHIHGPAPAGVSAGVLFDLTNTGGTMGTLTVTRTLTETEESQLLAGNWYANVHTVNYGGGEVRAQLIPLSSGETQYLTAAMDADEERAARPTPAITSSGLGTAVAVLDKVTRNIYLTGSYSNLSSGISNSHIHRHPWGLSGEISINLQFISGATSGTVSGSATNIRASLMDSIIAGNSYVNIHSSNYTGGEIRGQLGNIVLPVLLKYFNGYKEQSKIALIWESEQQINLDRYEIEQQNPETGKWISKSSIPATSSGTLGKLKFSDVPTNYNSTYVIYRLKMIDKDGKITYSQVIKINYKESKVELMIFGNPAPKGELNYMLTGLSSDSKTEVSVVDYSGRIVMKTIGRALMNNKVNIASLSSGVYKLVIKFDDNILQQSFIK